MSSSSSSAINSRLHVERAVDLKIREFIDNSPSIESKKLNINRLKCFYTAAKTFSSYTNIIFTSQFNFKPDVIR